MKKILITGGAGFVGGHLIEACLKRGLQVRVLDNFSCSSPRALDEYAKRIEVIKGDIRDEKCVKKALRNTDVVFHLAAITSVVKTVENPLLVHEVNAT